MMKDPDTPMGDDEPRSESAQQSEDEDHKDTIVVPVEEIVDGHHDRHGGSLEPAQPTNYGLFSNPPSLGLIRQRLFDIEDPIEMSISDFDTYFPFVDNVWRKCRGGETQKETDSLTDIYWCRLRKSGSAKPYTPKPTPEGKTSRKKRTREEKTCPMALKVVRKEGGSGICTVTRATGKGVHHSHDLDYMDGLKRNSGIMATARKEAVKGFLPGSVYWKMLEEPDKMKEAGGKFMKISDVRNVQYSWRQEHPDLMLKAHTGYSQNRLGSRPKPSTPDGPLAQSIPLAKRVQLAPPPPPVQALPPPTQQALAPVNGIIRDILHYPEHAQDFLQPYLPHHETVAQTKKPHVTLTYATSLDSRIALMPGQQTAISGPETKAMTHYLRSRHDAILIGVRTALADDPTLNCRLAGAGSYGGIETEQQPRPIIIDPHARLPIRSDMKILQVVAEGRAKGPWVVVAPDARLQPSAVQMLKAHGGEYLMINDVNPHHGRVNWDGIFNVLYSEGIRSVMIEGGGRVLSDLLNPHWSYCIDSVIMTIAPTFFGRAGVEVSPDPVFNEFGKAIPTRLSNVKWQPMGDVDVVMCGHIKMENPGPLLPGIQEFSEGPPQNDQIGTFD